MAILKKAWLRASATVLTLMLGIGLFVNAMESDETSTVSNTIQNEPWEYTGTPGNSAQETDASFYSRPSSPLSCPSGSNICGVVALEDSSNPGHPQLTAELQERIENRDTNFADVMLKN